MPAPLNLISEYAPACVTAKGPPRRSQAPLYSGLQSHAGQAANDKPEKKMKLEQHYIVTHVATYWENQNLP